MVGVEFMTKRTITENHFRDFQSNIIKHLECTRNVLAFLHELQYPNAGGVKALFESEMAKITTSKIEDLELNTSELQEVEQDLTKLTLNNHQDLFTAKLISELNLTKQSLILSAKLQFDAKILSNLKTTYEKRIFDLIEINLPLKNETSSSLFVLLFFQKCNLEKISSQAINYANEVTVTPIYQFEGILPSFSFIPRHLAGFSLPRLLKSTNQLMLDTDNAVFYSNLILGICKKNILFLFPLLCMNSMKACKKHFTKNH